MERERRGNPVEYDDHRGDLRRRRPPSNWQTATITVTSIADTTKTGTMPITIAAAPSVTSTSASVAGAVGSAYSVTLSASGGVSTLYMGLGKRHHAAGVPDT